MKSQNFKNTFEKKAKTLARTIHEIKIAILTTEEETAIEERTYAEDRFESFLKVIKSYLSDIRSETNSIFNYVCLLPKAEEQNKETNSPVFNELDELLDIINDIDDSLNSIFNSVFGIVSERTENQYNKASIDSYTDYLLCELNVCNDLADEIYNFFYDDLTQESESHE